MRKLLLSLLLLCGLVTASGLRAESAHILGLEISDSFQAGNDDKSCSHYSIYRILKYGYGQATTVNALINSIGYMHATVDLPFLGAHITYDFGTLNIGQPPPVLAQTLRNLGYANASEQGDASPDRIKDLLWSGTPVALLILTTVQEAFAPPTTGFPVPVLHWVVANGYDDSYLYYLDTTDNYQRRITWYDLDLIRYWKGKIVGIYSTDPVPGYGSASKIATVPLNLSTLENAWFGAVIDVVTSFGGNRGSILYFDQPLPASRVEKSGERFPGLTVNANWGARVVSSDGGIDCGLKCGATYRVGTEVTLFATVPPGSTLRGWIGPCQVSGNACRLTMQSSTFVRPIIDCPKCVATMVPILEKVLTSKSTVAPPPAGGINLNQHGITGGWYKPATSGQGLMLEVYPNLASQGTGYLQGAWFTFDHAAVGGPERQRWYTFGGNVANAQSPATFTIYQNTGGNFDALPATSAVAVGSATLAATTCDTGTLTYAFNDGSGRNGSIALSRLLANVECGGNNSGDFGYSGNWLDRDKHNDGQGFVIEINPKTPFAFVTWFTYAPGGQASGAAGQRWFTGQGAFTPGTRSMALKLYQTTGGLFDSTAATPTNVEVGSATLTFASCTQASLSYNFTAGSSSGRSGTIALARVGPAPATCAP